MMSFGNSWFCGSYFVRALHDTSGEERNMDVIWSRLMSLML